MSSSYKLPTTSYKLLKIGIVCYPTIGGSGIVATNLGLELSKLGHEVHFISYDEPFKLNGNRKVFFHKVQINKYSLFKYPDYTLPLSVKIVEVAHKHKLDILHVHYAVPHATAALLAKNIANEEKLHFPHVVTTLHGTDITLLAEDRSLMPIIKYSIESSCGVTAVSKSLATETVQNLKTHKPDVIYNFYDPKIPKISRSAMRKRLGIKVGDFLAIHLSNLRPVKRIPDLLKIMAGLKKHPNIKLLILAGGDFSPFKPLLNKLGLSKKIIVKPEVKNVENYINAADVGLYTSEEESFGLGILETMAYGKTVLATNIGGIPEVIGNSGFLFKVGDVKSFAKKLLELSSENEKISRLGEMAKIRAITKFSASIIVKQYLNYYREITLSCKYNK